MAYVDPNTVSNPTAGQAILASLGDNYRDNFQWLSGGFPHCSLTVSAAQSVVTGTSVVDLTADVETSDVGGMHSGSSATVTIPSGGGGLYDISAVVTYAANVTGIRQLTVDINGTPITLQKVNAAGTGSTALSGSFKRLLSAGDALKCQAAQTSGGNLDITLVDFSVTWRSTA